MKNSPSIMISSTFYDLRQVRSNLQKYITEDLRYSCLASEYTSFPVDPSLDTIENCPTQVNKNADVMVLIVGGRYGSIDDRSSKSITNLEFLAARKKGIPIYAFIEKSVLAVLPIWENNPDKDFSQTVDSPMLFEFINDIRSQKKVWVFNFETAEDIIDTLRLQLGYLFKDTLELLNRLGGYGLPSFFDKLSPGALRIALELPEAWEHRLFFQCLDDNVSNKKNLLREYKVGLTIEIAESVPEENTVDWMQTRLHEL